MRASIIACSHFAKYVSVFQALPEMMKGNNKVKVDSNDVTQETVIAFLHNSGVAANNVGIVVVMALFKLQITHIIRSNGAHLYFITASCRTFCS